MKARFVNHVQQLIIIFVLNAMRKTVYNVKEKELPLTVTVNLVSFQI